MTSTQTDFRVNHLINEDDDPRFGFKVLCGACALLRKLQLKRREEEKSFAAKGERRRERGDMSERSADALL